MTAQSDAEGLRVPSVPPEQGGFLISQGFKTLFFMPRGGFRPGAGRPKAATVAYQASRRDQLQKFVTDDDWHAIVSRAVADAKNGDYVARQWLTPYVAGKVPDEINANVAQVIEIVYSDSNSADPALPPQTTSRAMADHQ